MRRDSEISALHDHVADLSLAEILKNAIVASAVRITVFESFLTSDNNHERVLRWRYDAALLLTAVLRMNIESIRRDLLPNLPPFISRLCSVFELLPFSGSRCWAIPGGIRSGWALSR